MHPYRDLPDYRNWRRSMADLPREAVDPVVSPAFKITTSDRVATAGSCFAQHIARHLKTNGFNFLVSETAHPIASPKVAQNYNYGVFSARYGNVYTTRQLLQLFQRAYGSFQPAEDVWERADGRLVDPFRPQISPDGYRTRAELYGDREQHLAAVRRMFEELDVFVFTLGLTECWVSWEDGAAYPLCPGVAGGIFDPARYNLVNFTASETVADMRAFIGLLRSVNDAAKVILTVSPVPLIATAEDRHVLVSTTYSKAVLRVACDELTRALPEVAYFPSYEIITGPHARGHYFANDLRSVTEAGVSHVMRLFLAHYGDSTTNVLQQPGVAVAPEEPDIAALVAVVCDEEALVAPAAA